MTEFGLDVVVSIAYNSRIFTVKVSTTNWTANTDNGCILYSFLPVGGVHVFDQNNFVSIDWSAQVTNMYATSFCIVIPEGSFTNNNNQENNSEYTYQFNPVPYEMTPIITHIESTTFRVTVYVDSGKTVKYWEDESKSYKEVTWETDTKIDSGTLGIFTIGSEILEYFANEITLSFPQVLVFIDSDKQTPYNSTCITTVTTLYLQFSSSQNLSNVLFSPESSPDFLYEYDSTNSTLTVQKGTGQITFLDQTITINIIDSFVELSNPTLTFTPSPNTLKISFTDISDIDSSKLTITDSDLETVTPTFDTENQEFTVVNPPDQVYIFCANSFAKINGINTASASFSWNKPPEPFIMLLSYNIEISKTFKVGVLNVSNFDGYDFSWSPTSVSLTWVVDTDSLQSDMKIVTFTLNGAPTSSFSLQLVEKL